MFIFKICVWIKSGNIFLAHPVYVILKLETELFDIFHLKKTNSRYQIHCIIAFHVNATSEHVLDDCS